MNRKPFLISLTLALAASAFTQDASPKVTFTSVAVPINRALVEIGKQASVHLEAGPQAAGEILIVRLKDVTLEAAMKRIATATSCEWQPMEGGYRLVPNSIVRRQEEQAERTKYVAGLAKTLDQLVKSLNPPKPDPKAGKGKAKDTDPEEMAAQFGFGASHTPAGKAVIRLMIGIGAQNLANVDEKTRIVYSTNPTRMQRPLPGNWNSILAQLVAEHNTYAAKRQKDRSEEEAGIEDNEQLKKLKEMFGNFEDNEKPIEGTPTKAILVCSRQVLFGGLSLVLKVYNEKGQVIITGQQTLMAEDSGFAEFVGETVAKQKGETTTTPTPPANEKPIEFSASTKEFQSATDMMAIAMGGGSTAKMSEELKTKLLNPEMYDPLSFAPSEALIAIAEQRKEQLVATLPDEMDSMFSMMSQPKANLTPSSFLQQIKNTATVTEQDGWMIVQPAKPASARKRRFDRAALGIFIRSAESKGAYTLDDLAAYALKSVSPMENQGPMRYIMLFAPNAMQSGMAGLTSWDMLRFYGALSPTGKKSLIEGGQLPFSQLNPAQAAAVRQMAFGPEEMLTVDDPNKKDELGLMGMWKQMFMRAAGGDYRTEPTEVMPNGLPGDGYVVLKFSNDHVAKPAGNVPAMMGNAVLGADELAIFKFMSESESMQQFAAMMPKIEDIKLGKREVYEFKFVVAQGVSMSQTLNNDSFEKNTPVTKMANIPGDFQKKIAERMAMFKKLPFFDPAFFGGGKQAVPPL